MFTGMSGGRVVSKVLTTDSHVKHRLVGTKSHNIPLLVNSSSSKRVVPQGSNGIPIEQSPVLLIEINYNF